MWKNFFFKSQLDNHLTLHRLHHHRQLKKQGEQAKEGEGTQEPVAGTSTSTSDTVTSIPETQDQ